jgi:1-pyrroline-5-carboxylate dehydrogenase
MYVVLLLCCVASPAGAKLLWGGQPLQGHSIPACYGAIQPTAVFVPLKAMRDPEAFKLVTTEVFGPFQVITEYDGEAHC